MNKIFVFVRIEMLILFFILVVSTCAKGNKISVNIKTCSATNSLFIFKSNSDEILNPKSNPLYTQQWYLKNTGQSAFAENQGTADIDLRLDGVLQTGKGVVVNIVDTGLEIRHEDLRDNIIPSCSVNFLNNSNDPTNIKDTTGDHGTSVAGLIAAKSNNLGGIGVAPNAILIAHNFLAKQNAATFLTSILADTDIVNQSFGKNNTNDSRPLDFKITAYKDGVTNKRNNKGIIYLKSAGNGFQKEENTHCIAELTCYNANMNPVHTYPYNLVIAAINAQGEKSSYSTAGSAILLSGFGGENGRNYPAMITTDQSGCHQGYSRRMQRRNQLYSTSKIPSSLDVNCNYTSTFNGTSAAAPVVAGVVALMLETNPELTWRDVRHILIKTARKIDPTRSALYYRDIATKNIPDLNDATVELGWTTNKVGLEFHNWYGFGLVDASNAIKMAKSYSTDLGNFQEIVTDFLPVNSIIPDASTKGITSEIEFRDSVTIESVQIDIKITHEFTANLGIFLESPQGTTSLLLNFANAFANTDDLNMLLASQTFYGEQAIGTWKLKVIDYKDEDIGTLDRWNLKIYGH